LNKITALQVSLVAIVSVALFEAIAGTIANSLVIMSDAAHAAFDAITTLMLLVTTRLAQRPPDENHTYGHGKIESIGGLTAGISLLVIAVSLMYESGSRLAFGATPPQPELVGFLAIGYTLCIDFLRVVLLRGSKEESVTVKANLYHAIGDMGSTVVAMSGFFLATKAGLPQADAIGTLALGIFLAYLSVSLARGSGMELSDAIPRNVLKDIQKRVLEMREVLELKELKARKVGSKYFVDVTTIVSEYTDLQGAHETATRIEGTITNLLKNAAVVVHTEPRSGKSSLRSKIESMTLAVQDIKGVHNVAISHSAGILHIILHAQVDANLSIEKAHRIAERVEKDLHDEVGKAAKITVHLEPFIYRKVGRDNLSIEKSLEAAVKQLTEKRSGIRTKTITTYLSGGKRYANITLIFDRNCSVEEAHGISTEMERALQYRFDNIIATIHTEPEVERALDNM
jgi:cation diffusion facilitator family transporter